MSKHQANTRNGQTDDFICALHLLHKNQPNTFFYWYFHSKHRSNSIKFFFRKILHNCYATKTLLFPIYLLARFHYYPVTVTFYFRIIIVYWRNGLSLGTNFNNIYSEHLPVNVGVSGVCISQDASFSQKREASQPLN